MLFFSHKQNVLKIDPHLQYEIPGKQYLNIWGAIWGARTRYMDKKKKSRDALVV